MLMDSLKGPDDGLSRHWGLTLKKIVFATTLLALGSASAFAADLGERMYAKAPVAAPVANWSGLYIGGNVGYGWGNGHTDIANVPAADFLPFTVDNQPKGVIGGAQVGYNWQMGSFLAGVETDIQGSGIKGRFSDLFSPTDQQLSWFGTFRGRLGFVVAPELLLYGTGGLAYGDASGAGNVIFRLPGNTIVAQFPGGFSGTRTGWSAGGGAEWMFARNWSAKAEYLHVDLGNAFRSISEGSAVVGGVINYNWHNQFDIVRLGVNYHFN
jgi:outer membrane immunogenic protein